MLTKASIYSTEEIGTFSAIPDYTILPQRTGPSVK
jgi:hypothetical protein